MLELPGFRFLNSFNIYHFPPHKPVCGYQRVIGGKIEPKLITKSAPAQAVDMYKKSSLIMLDLFSVYHAQRRHGNFSGCKLIYYA